MTFKHDLEWEREDSTTYGHTLHRSMDMWFVQVLAAPITTTDTPQTAGHFVRVPYAQTLYVSHMPL